MNASLLATRIRIPPARGHDVPRRRLSDALTRGVLTHPLTLVSAPAGYGKTTLLRQWASEPPAPVAWYSIEDVDNDRVRFLRYLVAAWGVVWPEIAESPLGLLLGSAEPDVDAVVTACLDPGVGRQDPVILVLDDFDLIVDPTIHRDATFLLDHLPAQVHVVLAGRAEPPLPLARYRAHQELFELHADALRFRRDEVEAFFHEVRGTDLPAETVGAIGEQVEGWAVGLQLCALALPARVGGKPPVVSGRHRFIADYLRAEVLAHLPARQQRFLLRTSLLDRLSGPLCEAVSRSGGGQAMLEELERANLFIMALDDQREWFRYHPLFADVLRDDLARQAPDEVPALHHRAARWYLDQGLPDLAMRHALAGADGETVGFIFERHLSQELNTGGQQTIQRWLDAIPAGWFTRYPMLGLARAGLLLTSGAVTEGIRCIDEVETRLAEATGPEVTRHRAMVAAVRCFVACQRNDLPEAERLAAHAMRDLPAGHLSFRSDVCHALGETYRRNGRWAEAKAAYLEVLRIHHGPTFPIRAASVYGALADLELRRGRLGAADACWRQALAAIADHGTWGRLPLTVTGWVHLRIAELHYQRDELDDARAHLARGLARADLGGDAQTLLAGHVIAARILLTAGDVAAATQHLDQVRLLAEEGALPDWQSRFERGQLDLWLDTGRVDAAVAWARAMVASSELDHRPESEPARLGAARALLQLGDRGALRSARVLLDCLAASAEAEGRLGIRIEALALLALWHGQMGETAPALTDLERAVRLAEPERYIRLFADLGPPMVRLLQEARTRHTAPAYVARLLASCATAGTTSRVPDPMSEREREVLRLLAAGLTNREIAGALFISPETVKKHTGAIFGKLGVGNRTEAAARARALDLLREYP